jgi:pseudouridine kinase
MTNRELEIMALIKENPMISQKDIGEILGITRSSVGVHLANLMKKGFIKGKGYILDDAPYVVVIGGSNMDILGTPMDALVFEDSNPGKISLSLGGVGRNIAENLVKLDIRAKLLSVVGNDVYGEKILSECNSLGIDMEHVQKINGVSTSTYLSILDDTGNMKLALSDMDITGHIDKDYINSNSEIIKNAQYVVVDTNLEEDVINYLVNNFKGPKFILDTVSAHKAKKVKDIIGKFHMIKPNRIESEVITGIEISDMKSIEKTFEYYYEKGVDNVILSLGKDGVAYKKDNQVRIYKNPEVKVINANGAGDTFTAALVYSVLNGMDIEETVKFSSTAAMVTLKSKDTISDNLSVELVNKMMEEI